MDFNSAGPQKGAHKLIPNGTIAPVIITIKPGGQGEGGWLTASRSSDALMLNCEFTVMEGPFAKRKIWQYMTISGGKTDEHGNSIAAEISGSLLRAILESARNVRPDDQSEAAKKARCIDDWGDFNGMSFWAKIGVEKDKSGQYGDKNKIAAAVTPDMNDFGGPLPQPEPKQSYTPPPASFQQQQPPVTPWENQQQEAASGPRPSWA